MLVGLFMITTVSFLILVFLTTAVDSSRWTARESDEYHMEAVAESAVAATVHSVWGPLSRSGYRAARSLLVRPHLVMSAVSGMAAQEVSRALGMPVGVLPNAIDPAPWRRREPVPRVDGVLRLVTVSRLAPRKRIGPLLSAIARAQVLVGRLRSSRPPSWATVHSARLPSAAPGGSAFR